MSDTKSRMGESTMFSSKPPISGGKQNKLQLAPNPFSSSLQESTPSDNPLNSVAQPSSQSAPANPATVNRHLIEENRKLREQIAQMMSMGKINIAPRKSKTDEPNEEASSCNQAGQSEAKDATVGSSDQGSQQKSAEEEPSKECTNESVNSPSKARAHPNFLTPSNNALGLIRIATRANVRQHIVDFDNKIQIGLQADKAEKCGCSQELLNRLKREMTSFMTFVCHGLGGNIENNVVSAAKENIAREGERGEHLSPWQQLERHGPKSDRIGAALMTGILHVSVNSLAARGFAPNEVRIAEGVLWRSIFEDASATANIAQKLQRELSAIQPTPSLEERLLIPNSKGYVPGDLVKWMEDARERSVKTRGKRLQTFKDWGSGRRRRGRLVDKSGKSVSGSSTEKLISHSRFHLSKPKTPVINVAHTSRKRDHAQFSTNSGSGRSHKGLHDTSKMHQNAAKRAKLHDFQNGGNSTNVANKQLGKSLVKRRAPSVTSIWLDSEDYLLFTLHCKLGNTWSAIASRMNELRERSLLSQKAGRKISQSYKSSSRHYLHTVRTDNQIKNRYYSTKRRLSRRDASTGTTVAERFIRPYLKDKKGPPRLSGQTLIEHLMVHRKWQENQGAFGNLSAQISEPSKPSSDWKSEEASSVERLEVSSLLEYNKNSNVNDHQVQSADKQGDSEHAPRLTVLKDKQMISIDV